MADGLIVPIFDGHNGALLCLALSGAGAISAFQRDDGSGPLDLPRARRGGFVAALFACFAPPPDRGAGLEVTADGYTVAMPDPPGLAQAQSATEAMIACAHRLAADAPAGIEICHDVAAIRDCLALGRLAIVRETLEEHGHLLRVAAPGRTAFVNPGTSEGAGRRA